MFNPFTYIATRVRNAVIRGFGEGLEAVGALEPDDAKTANPMEALQARIAALALADKPADPEAAESNKKARKPA